IQIKPPRPVRDSVPVKPGDLPGKDTVISTDQVKDPDGNSYNTISIGKLRWMRENLRTTRYNDGSPIQGNLSNAAWESAHDGAYAIYENNSQYDAVYGKLYNGYAVATGKLCPLGWRLPTDRDWQDLESSIGMSSELLGVMGGRGNMAGLLKEPGLWDPSGEPSSNSSGFSIRPAGIRSANGDFLVLKQYGDFWTSTVYENPYALYLWKRHFYYNSSEIGRNYLSANNGYSCRCVQDLGK
ncbi:MAG: fibrobacter succinogenes major paralogous domain-containing protein, partial [Chitinophagaceae bacterium]